MRQLLLLFAISLPIWWTLWQAQEYLAGKQPHILSPARGTTSQNAHAAGESEDSAAYDDDMLVKLRAKAREEPQRLEQWQALSLALIDKIRNFEKPPQPLLFETIDALREVLRLDPKNAEALIAMADLAFDQQTFAKARSFYERYLEEVPADRSARARYASSLTFLGEFDGAIAELNRVLNEDPKNFHAHAYLAITYAEKGDLAKAQSFGTRALTLAPSTEARERFREFLARLTAEKPARESADRTSIRESSADTPADQPPSDLVLSDAAELVVSAVRQNPVAGPKFAGAGMHSDTEIVIRMRDFPMDRMPPVAQQKFFSLLKDAARKRPGGPLSVRFIDAATAQPLATLDLRAP